MDPRNSNDDMALWLFVFVCLCVGGGGRGLCRRTNRLVVWQVGYVWHGKMRELMESVPVGGR